MTIKHRLLSLSAAVEKTHTGLGALTSFAVVSAKAKKSLLVIGVAGSGKSVALEAVAKSNPDGLIEIDALTRSGLGKIHDKMTGFKGSLHVDDLGGIDTNYSLNETLKGGIILTYAHKLSKLNVSTDFKIADFHGSFSSTIQPSKVQRIVNTTDWEAVIRDKLLRYYHLVRPANPTTNPLTVKIDWGLDLDKVRKVIKHTSHYDKVFRLGLSQWGKGRTKQHIDDLLRAVAALDHRRIVLDKDCAVLWWLLQPMRLESFFISKQGFESDKVFKHEAMCLLTEFASYEKLTIDNIMQDYQLREQRARLITFGMNELCYPDPADKKAILPTEVTLELLARGGYKI